MPDDLEDLHRTILKTQAMYFALESLCVALVSFSTDKNAVIERFHDLKLDLTNRLLYSDEMPDVVFQELEAAHERISAQLSPLRSDI